MTEGNGYTQADNWLWDYVMPKALPSTFKVVAAVLRMTAGWHIDCVELTFDDFQVITGIDNRGTLTNAIKDALAQGFIERAKVGKSFAYSLKIVPIDSPKIVPGDKKRSKNRTDNQSKNRTEYAKDESENRTATVEALKESKEKEKERKKSPPPPKKAKFVFEFPDCLNVPNFREVWSQFEEHRREIKKPLTERAGNMQLKKLADMPVAVAIAMVEQSIANGWQGIFELKGGLVPAKNGRHPPAQKDATWDRLYARLED